MADLTPQIEQAAKDPRSVSVDGSNVQAIPVTEVIEADKYLKAQAARAKNHLGLSFRKLISGD